MDVQNAFAVKDCLKMQMWLAFQAAGQQSVVLQLTPGQYLQLPVDGEEAVNGMS